MAQMRRHKPRKALTRKDFRYKRDWKYYKENQQEHLMEDFEEEDDNLDRSGIILAFGVLLTFIKFLEFGGSAVGIIVKYGFGFITVAGINAIGIQMTTVKGKKTRITGKVFEIITYFAFATLVYFIIIAH